MQQWQYMIVERNLPVANTQNHWQFIQDVLNNYGIERWELVGFAVTERQEGAILIYTFKRPIE